MIQFKFLYAPPFIILFTLNEQINPQHLSTVLVVKAAGGWSNKNETLTLVIRGKPRI